MIYLLHTKEILAEPMPAEMFDALTESAALSHKAQTELEAGDTLDFDADLRLRT